MHAAGQGTRVPGHGHRLGHIAGDQAAQGHDGAGRVPAARSQRVDFRGCGGGCERGGWVNAGSSRTSGAQAWGTSEPSHHLLPGSDDCPAWWPPGSVCCSWDVWTQLGSVSVASWTRAQGPFPPLGAWPDPWPLLPQAGQLPGPAACLTAERAPCISLPPRTALSSTPCQVRPYLGSSATQAAGTGGPSAQEVQPTRCPQVAPSLQPQSPSSRVFAPPCFVLHADPPPNSTPVSLRGGPHPCLSPPPHQLWPGLSQRCVLAP